ncbi:hypothetical protein V7166_23130 [Bacillus thuringiensis]
MKSREEMLKAIVDFQNRKVDGVTIMHDNEEVLDFCVKLVYEIYVEQKHTFEASLKD